MGCSRLLAPEETALHRENPKLSSTRTFSATSGLKIQPARACPLFVSVFQDEMLSTADPAVLWYRDEGVSVRLPLSLPFEFASF